MLDYNKTADSILEFMGSEIELFMLVSAEPGSGKSAFIRNYFHNNLRPIVLLYPSSCIKDIYIQLLNGIIPSSTTYKKSESDLREMIRDSLDEINVDCIIIDDSQNMAFVGKHIYFLLSTLKWLAEVTSTKFIFFGENHYYLPTIFRSSRRVYYYIEQDEISGNNPEKSNPMLRKVRKRVPVNETPLWEIATE